MHLWNSRSQMASGLKGFENGKSQFSIYRVRIHYELSLRASKLLLVDKTIQRKTTHPTELGSRPSLRSLKLDHVSPIAWPKLDELACCIFQEVCLLVVSKCTETLRLTLQLTSDCRHGTDACDLPSDVLVASAGLSPGWSHHRSRWISANGASEVWRIGLPIHRYAKNTKKYSDNCMMTKHDWFLLRSCAPMFLWVSCEWTEYSLFITTHTLINGYEPSTKSLWPLMNYW